MLHCYSDEELRSLCRQSIKSLEMWARRLIHEKFTQKYGLDFVSFKTSGENYLVKKDVRTHIQEMLKKDPGRFPRAVDTLFFEHIIYFLCNPTFYCDLFQDALMYAYPQGHSEAREFLGRVVPIRNALSHSNPISIRQAEQAICYSHDFVDGLKKYYQKEGMEKVWNVPRITRITDSLGNSYDNPTDTHGQQSIFNPTQEIHCGDTYSVTIDIDSSFSEEEYDIIWKNRHRQLKNFDNCKQLTLTFEEADVSQVHTIECQIISHKAWHKHQHYDCSVTLMFTVYPPV